MLGLELPDCVEAEAKRLGDAVVIDYAAGNVTGGNKGDRVFLLGTRSKDDSAFYENLTPVVYRETGQCFRLSLPEKEGYYPKLFLGDFSRDGIDEVMITLHSGGTGDYVFNTIFIWRRGRFTQIFNTTAFNRYSRYTAVYLNLARMRITNRASDISWNIDLSCQSNEYLNEIYDREGALLRPLQGEVLELGAIWPIVNDERSGFDLLAQQRIIGLANADSIGEVQTLLSWQSVAFVASRVMVSGRECMP